MQLLPLHLTNHMLPSPVVHIPPTNRHFKRFRVPGNRYQRSVVLATTLTHAPTPVPTRWGTAELGHGFIRVCTYTRPVQSISFQAIDRQRGDQHQPAEQALVVNASSHSAPSNVPKSRTSVDGLTFFRQSLFISHEMWFYTHINVM